MEPTQELVDDIYREKVLRARATPPEQKLFAGAELFAMVCELMKAGIRSQFPEAEDSRVTEILQQRLDLSRRLRNSDDRRGSDAGGH